jgi:hypothetical protein
MTNTRFNTLTRRETIRQIEAVETSANDLHNIASRLARMDGVISEDEEADLDALHSALCLLEVKAAKTRAAIDQLVQRRWNATRR